MLKLLTNFHPLSFSLNSFQLFFLKHNLHCEYQNCHLKENTPKNVQFISNYLFSFNIKLSIMVKQLIQMKIIYMFLILIIFLLLLIIQSNLREEQFLKLIYSPQSYYYCYLNLNLEYYYFNHYFRHSSYYYYLCYYFHLLHSNSDYFHSYWMLILLQQNKIDLFFINQ